MKKIIPLCIAVYMATSAIQAYSYPVIINGQYTEWTYTETETVSEVSQAQEMTEESARVFMPFDNIPLSPALQELLWKECQKYGIEFTFALGTIQLESDFKTSATNHNSNGTTDRGICQTNSCWIKTLKNLGMITKADDLYIPEIGIKCGMWELGKCVEKYGNTERAYAYYNTGRESVTSNKASRKVWQYTQNWRNVL